MPYFNKSLCDVGVSPSSDPAASTPDRLLSATTWEAPRAGAAFQVYPFSPLLSCWGNQCQEDQEVSVATAALEVQAPAVLRIHGVTGLPHKGPWPSRYRPGPESHSCLSHPQRQDWKDWGLSWSSPFLIPLSVAFPVYPAFHLSITMCHFPSLALRKALLKLEERETRAGGKIRAMDWSQITQRHSSLKLRILPLTKEPLNGIRSFLIIFKMCKECSSCCVEPG